MKRKRVILIDDERLARVELRNLLSSFPEIEIIAEAENADQGILLIEEHQPDLLFLDIQMPGQSGFDLLEELEVVPAVIFTTAYDEYAIKAFEFNALDYLLKPIQTDRLKEALDRAFAKKELTEIEAVPENQAATPYFDHVYLKDGDKNYFVKLSDIYFFTSFGNYVKVHFAEASILVHRSLNQMESRLKPQHFFRANRYSIINLHHIRDIQQGFKGKLLVTMVNGQNFELSERKSILFREIFGI